MKTKLLTAIFALGWLCSGIAFAQAPDTLFISTTQVVHIRFGSELKYVNLGNKAIVAKIVDGSKDYVAVKAREPFDICTSMSCLESTGAMHTFMNCRSLGGTPFRASGHLFFFFSAFLSNHF